MELKPCPFCGDNVKIGGMSCSPPKSYGIVCLGCGAKPWLYVEKKRKLIKDWNRRSCKCQKN